MALLQSLAANNCQVLATAPTNVAICELASRYNAVLSRQSFMCLKDMVLLGRLTRLQLESSDPLLNIHLETRVEKVKYAVEKYAEYLFDVIYDFDFSILDDEVRVKNNLKCPSRTKFLENINSLFDVLWILVHFAPPSIMRGDCLNFFQQQRVQDAFKFFSQNLTEKKFLAWMRVANDKGKIEVMMKSEYSQLVEHISVIRSLSNCLKRDYAYTMRDLPLDILNQAKVVFSTITVAGRAVLQRINFDVVIIDEASKMVQAETTIILRPSLRCLVLVGDNMQLPATVLSPASERMGYSESLFERLIGLKHDHLLLNIQYRMHPDISKWPAEQFYFGGVEDGENVRSLSYKKPWHPVYPPLVVFNVDIGHEATDDFGSKYNEQQATLVRRIVAKIRNYAEQQAESLTVGVISPYKEQVNILLHLQGKIVFTCGSVHVKVGTVDSFQGQECDIIILTTVRSNNHGNIGFLKDYRRLNVAITRSKYTLIIVCDCETLRHDVKWRSFLEYAKTNGSVYDKGNNEPLKRISRQCRGEELRIDAIMGGGANVFENAPWHVILSSDFKVSMQNLPGRNKTAVMKRIVGIAHGEWPKHERKHPRIPTRYQDMLHIYHINTLYRLIWSVDVKRSEGRCEQCIKVWDVVTEESLNKSIRRIDSSLRTYTESYISRCESLCFSRDSERIFHPDVWTTDIEWHEKPSRKVSNLENCNVQSAAVLMKFYSLSTSTAKVLATSSGHIDLPFVMSREEDCIVRSEKSELIMGRSGTGL